MADRVRGYFHDKEKVGAAVDRLIREKVPPDQIRVTVEDADGTELREIPVKERMGALRGALRGAVAGAAFGVVAVLLLGAGAFSWVGLEPLGGGLLMAMVRGGVAGAMAGVPIGGVLAMADWRGEELMGDQELTDGAAVVTVEGEGVADRARSVLSEADPARMAD